MRKISIVALFVLFVTKSYGQNFWYDQPYVNGQKKDGSVARSFIATEGTYSYGCDGINNEFLTSLYRGGYLDSSFIANSAEKLLPVNRMGVQTCVGITYSQRVKDTTGESWSLSLLRRNNISGRFSDDAFRLAFQGNTRFKGEEADFSRTRFNSMSWSQVKFGYQTPQPNGALSFSFSLLAGHQYNQANVEYGKLYTDSQGLNLSSSVAGDYWSSDTTNKSQYAINGFGTSVDITWIWWKKLPKANFHIVRFDLIDFGFINWNDRTIHRTVDTTFTWYGVDITPMFIDPDYVAELPEQNDFVKSDTSEFHRSIFLPAVARGMYTRWFCVSRLMLKASAAIPLWSEAMPYASLTTGWRADDFMVSGGIAYGGYARLMVPLKAEIYAIRQSCIEIGTHNALALFMPDAMAGGGAFIKLSYAF